MTDEIDPRDQEFARRTRQLLQDSATRLDARTRSRLTQARHAALAAHGRGVLGLNLRRWLPAGAVAASVLAVLLVVGHGPAPPVANAAGGEDFDLLADSDALALAQDDTSPGQDVDYDFYEWAATAGQDAGGGAVGT